MNKNPMNLIPVLIIIFLLVCLVKPDYAEGKGSKKKTESKIGLRKGFGLGIIFSEETGISCKFWNKSKTAIDCAVVWSTDKDILYTHINYLIHDYEFIKTNRSNLPIYFGIGGKARFEEKEKSKWGIRLPLGMDYIVLKTPLDIFLEVALYLDLMPNTEAGLTSAVGIRYSF